MKKSLTLGLAAAICLSLASCASGGSLLGGTATTGSQTGTAGDLISGIDNILGNLLGKTALTEKDLYGTWNYDGSDCVFESENLLLKAGGAAAATKIEKEIDQQMAKIGVKQGACSFTFNEDKTFKATAAGKTLTGKYTYDPQTKKLKLSGALGLATITGYAVRSGNGISLLFDSDKMLSLVGTVAKLSGNSTLSTIGSIAQKYDGMQIGLRMKK